MHLVDPYIPRLTLRILKEHPALGGHDGANLVTTNVTACTMGKSPSDV